MKDNTLQKADLLPRSRFRRHKSELGRLFAEGDWRDGLARYIDEAPSVGSLVSPLLALLPRCEFTGQAAYGLGLAVSKMAATDMESARIVMRRLMWSMNEESGNLGWGIPEAMGSILAMSPPLAEEYGHMLISYAHDTGHEDNFIEHAPLRQSVYRGIGIFAASDPVRAKPALPHLVKALDDEDEGVRNIAAFALEHLKANLQGTTEDTEKMQGMSLVLT